MPQKNKIIFEDKMIGKKDVSLLESMLFLRAIQQYEGKRKAAELLGTSVDTINKYIENLEQALELKLIATNGRGSILTSAGKALVAKTDKIKEILDDIQSVRLESKEIKGEVNVFLALGYASYMIPQDLSSLFDIFPKLSINSVTALDTSSLDTKDIDIALTFEEINDPDVVSITEKQIYCGFFASSQYLAQKGYPIDLDDLVQNHRLIAKHDSMLKRILGEERYKSAQICFRSNNTLALINALENSTGVGIMPLSFALQGLVCLDNITCPYPITYHIYANRHTKDIPKVRTLINFYKDIMDKMENPVPVPALRDEPLPTLKQFG